MLQQTVALQLPPHLLHMLLLQLRRLVDLTAMAHQVPILHSHQTMLVRLRPTMSVAAVSQATRDGLHLVELVVSGAVVLNQLLPDRMETAVVFVTS